MSRIARSIIWRRWLGRRCGTRRKESLDTRHRKSGAFRLGAFRVRVWQITSEGRRPPGRRPPRAHVLMLATLLEARQWRGPGVRQRTARGHDSVANAVHRWRSFVRAVARRSRPEASSAIAAERRWPRDLRFIATARGPVTGTQTVHIWDVQRGTDVSFRYREP